jgi:RimJ/RimL family protein N-acetyltransferase
MICLFLFIIIILYFLIIKNKSNTNTEQFTNINVSSNKSNIKKKTNKNDNNNFLEKCFTKGELESFSKYYKYSSVYKYGDSMCYITPSKYIEEIPQITWSGYFLNNLCTNPEKRNNGSATNLLLSLIKKLKREGASHIILTVNKDNIKAIKLYEKLKFKIHNEGMNPETNKIVINYVYYL